MSECTAVREGDELSECVGTFGATEEGCVSNLLMADLDLGCDSDRNPWC